MALSSDSAFVQVNVRYKVEGLNQAAKGARKASGEFGKLGKILKQVGSSLLAFKAVDLVRQSLQKTTVELIRSNAQFERFEIQLKVFTGSATKAADLINFLAFQSTKLAGGLEDLLGGSTALATFGIDIKENLTLIADVATATNRAVEDVAIAFGRIVAGDPRTKQFLVTRRGDMAAFNRVLAQTGDRLKATRAAFSRFEGVSAELEGSFGRLTENIGDLLFVVAKFVGEPAFEALKNWLQETTDILRGEVFTGEGSLRKDNIFVGLRNDIEALMETMERLRGFYKDFESVRQWLMNPFGVVGGAYVRGQPKDAIDIKTGPFGDFLGSRSFITPEEMRQIILDLGVDPANIPGRYKKLFEGLDTGFGGPSRFDFGEKMSSQLRSQAAADKLFDRRAEDCTKQRRGGMFPFEIGRTSGTTFADMMGIPGEDPHRFIDEAQDLWDDIAVARMSGEMQAFKFVRNLREEEKRQSISDTTKIK